VPRRRPIADPPRVCFHKGTGTRYRSTLHRADGAVIELDGGSWNRIGGPIGRVPHDLAHLVVEEQLGLTRGLWGILAAGGLVRNAAYIGGRRPAHALARAKAIADAAGEELRQAEVLVRAAADARARAGALTSIRCGERSAPDGGTPRSAPTCSVRSTRACAPRRSSGTPWRAERSSCAT
jgi:hypothetical protein